MKFVVSGLMRIFAGSASRIRNAFFRLLGVEMKGYSWLRGIEIPRNWSDVCLESCALDRGVVLLCSGPKQSRKLHIGEGTYINRYTMIDAHRGVKIGKQVMIGPHCYITDGNHNMEPGIPIKSQPMSAKEVVIKDEAWIGAQVSIMPGVTIGKGAVVGAGSVVTRDIPAWGVAYGIPATVRKMRKPELSE